MSTRYSVILSGGAGRILTAIPALEAYVYQTCGEVRIFTYGWSELFLGNPTLQNISFDINQKGNSEYMRQSKIIAPEPYFSRDYMNQDSNLVLAWGEVLDVELDESAIEGSIYLSTLEQDFASNAVESLKRQMNKNKVVVFQPYGSGAKLSGGKVMDSSNRSLPTDMVRQIGTELSKVAGVIYFGPDEMFPEGTPMANTKELVPNRDLRFWAAMIANSDGFIGIDSVGQHMARAFDKKTSLILGATFRENISYETELARTFRNPDFRLPTYVPIRLNTVDADLADRMNDGIMNFSKEETDKIINDSIDHLELKPKKIDSATINTFDYYKNDAPKKQAPEPSVLMNENPSTLREYLNKGSA